jgi:hypothetical protein
MRPAKRRSRGVVSIKQIPTGFALGIRVWLHARPVQAHSAIRQDREVVDVPSPTWAITTSCSKNLGFKIALWYRTDLENKTLFDLDRTLGHSMRSCLNA